MIPRGLLLLSLLWGGLVCQPAWADPLDRWERHQERRDQRMEDRLTGNLRPSGPTPAARRLGPGEAARLAQERNGGGRVLDVVPAGEGWRVKLLKAGEVRTVLVTDTH